MRLFVALELPAALRAELGRRVAELRRDLPPARWVRAESYHLTLVFLGETPSSRESALAARLDGVFRRAAAFDLQLGGAGCFPPGRPARVIWVGLAPEPRLLELRAAVDAACRAELDLAPERRPYEPHLTVARCRRPWPVGAARRWSEGLSGRIGRPFRVREGVLMESRLEPAGASYRARARMPVGAEA